MQYNLYISGWTTNIKKINTHFIIKQRNTFSANAVSCNKLIRQ